LPSALQIIHIALDGHVVQAQQVVEGDAMALAQLLLVCALCYRPIPLSMCTCGYMTSYSTEITPDTLSRDCACVHALCMLY